MSWIPSALEIKLTISPENAISLEYQDHSEENVIIAVRLVIR